MQAALHSWSFRDKFAHEPGFSLLRALDETAAMGFTAIEIMSGKAQQGCGDFESFDPMYLDRVTRHARAVGVSIAALSPYNDFAYVADESWRQANIAFIKDQLRLASDLQIPVIRVMTGYRVDDVPAAQLEQLVVDAFAECAPVAEQVGVTMALENHSSVLATAEEILGLLDRIGSPRLSTCPDPTNFVYGALREGATPDMWERVYAQTALVAPRAGHAHIKYAGLNADNQWKGFDLNRLIAIYRDASYDGPMAIESVRSDDLLAGLAEARKVLEAAMARPQP
ncbi:MAG: TIM barrel protein [Chitinivibrionales bacterium]|nr:TIM barrel protein [Chitinivibrionales bacterium]